MKSHGARFALLAGTMLALISHSAALARRTSSVPREADLQVAVQSVNDFSFDLYGELASREPTGNLFFSPASISTALAMTYAGARGETAEEMKTALRFGLDEDPAGAPRHLVRSLDPLGRDQRRVRPGPPEHRRGT